MPQLRWQIQGEPIVATPPSNLFLRTRGGGGGEVGKAHYPHFCPNLNIPLSFLDYFSPNDQIDKLPIHLKYFCGDAAERTEAQARQQRNSDRDGGGGNGRLRRGSRPGGNSGGDDKRGDKRKESNKSKESTEMKMIKKPPEKNAPAKNATAKKPKKTSEKPEKKPEKKAAKTAGIEKPPSEVKPRAGSQRNAALKAASQISRSAADWMPPDGEDDDSGVSDSESEPPSSDVDSGDSDSSSDSELERAREKQRQALEIIKGANKPVAKANNQRAPSKAKKGKTPSKKKPAAKGKAKAKQKKFDDDSDESSYSSSDSESGDVKNEIDMAALMEKAMAGAKNSVLHSLCWWRIVLGKAAILRCQLYPR